MPATTTFTYEEPANRLTNGLRFIWAIPAIVIAAVLGIAMFFVVIVSWFVIVITGKHPRGMFGFILQVFRYILQTHSYVLLMTDTYPSWRRRALRPARHRRRPVPRRRPTGAPDLRRRRARRHRSPPIGRLAGQSTAAASRR